MMFRGALALLAGIGHCAPHPSLPATGAPSNVKDAGMADVRSATPEAADASSDAPADVPAPAQLVDVDAAAWMTARGARRDDPLVATLGVCREVRVGPSGTPALACDGGPPMRGSLVSGESVFALRIVAVDHGTPRALLETPISAGAMDREAPDEPNYLDLEWELDDSGLVVVVRDRPGAKCEERIADYVRRGGLERHIRMIQLACRSRGRWAWTNGRFVRAP